MINWDDQHDFKKEKSKYLFWKIADWIKEGGDNFALGTKTYTLADVMLTNLIVRMAADKRMFTKRIYYNTTLRAYWERVSSRPSFVEANLYTHKIWTGN
jgi:glutathione S-transferase